MKITRTVKYGGHVETSCELTLQLFYIALKIMAGWIPQSAGISQYKLGLVNLRKHSFWNNTFFVEKVLMSAAQCLFYYAWDMKNQKPV